MEFSFLKKGKSDNRLCCLRRSKRSLKPLKNPRLQFPSFSPPSSTHLHISRNDELTTPEMSKKALVVLPLVERSSLCFAARTVLAKEGDFPGSNDGRRWKSNAATSASSDIPSSHRLRRRVSKEERRALVESYVNEYRERNDGKFPTVTDAMKHAGGSYYVVRKIVQELEYTSKLPQLKSRTMISTESENNNAKKSLTDVRKFSQTVTGDADREDVDQQLAKVHLKKVKEDVKDASMSSSKLEYHKEEENYFRGTDPNKLRAKNVEQRPTDDLRNQTEKPEESVTLEAKEHPLQAPPDPDVSTRRKDNAEYSGETSFWGSLKTLADGIISLWRRK